MCCGRKYYVQGWFVESVPLGEIDDGQNTAIPINDIARITIIIFGD